MHATIYSFKEWEWAVVSIVCDIAIALHDLHTVCKIIHRDVKPTNILFSEKLPTDLS